MKEGPQPRPRPADGRKGDARLPAPRCAERKFFHTEGYSFPYTHMHYVLVAGGNAFYEKR